MKRLIFLFLALLVLPAWAQSPQVNLSQLAHQLQSGGKVPLTAVQNQPADTVPCNSTSSSTALVSCTTFPPLFQFWPRTSAEIAASVTPTNYLYKPGNVLRYGADPTGSTDSAGACTLANAALSGTNGGVIYFPAGIYHISSCTITKQAAVYGDGIGATQIYANDATSNVFIVNTSSVVFHDFAMLNAVTRTGGRYIYYQSGSSIGHVFNLYLSGWWVGIDLEGTNYNLHDIEMRNGVASNGNGIAIGLDVGAGNLSDISVVNVKIDNPTGAKPFSCIQLQKSGDVTLIDDQLQHCGFGLAVQPGGTNVVTSLLAVNTFFDNSGTDGAILQPQAAGAAIIRIRFNGCWFSSAGTFGALLDTNAHGGTIDGVTFIDPQVYLNGSHGISLSGSPVRTSILGGQFAGNTNSGLLVNAGVSQFRVIGATLGPIGSVSANVNGITIISGASNNFVVMGNDVSGNTVAISDGSTGTSKVIAGNIGYNPTGQVTAFSSATSPQTFTNKTGSPVLFIWNGGTITSVVVGTATVGNSTNGSTVLQEGQTVTVSFSAGTTTAFYQGL